MLFSFFFFVKKKHSLFKSSNSLYVYIFSFLSFFLFFFSTNKTELYHIHSLIRRLTSIILSMIAGLCCLYTSNELECCHSFFFYFFFRPKKRLVTRNHLCFRQKKKISIDRFMYAFRTTRFQLVSCH